MFKVSLFLVCFIRLLFCCLGEELPEGTPDRTTVCAGTPLRGSCPSGEVIAVKQIQYGTKETCAPPNCCDYDITDCLKNYTDTAQQAACSGKEVCDEITVAQADTSSCGGPYPNPGLNTYLTMEYYCIHKSMINDAVESGNKFIQTSPGNIAYLHNTQYPSPIRAATLNRSCSVEANTCNSQIKNYFIHFELADSNGSCSNSQTIKINDDMSSNTYTCSHNTKYEITLMMTSSSNYIIVHLENPNGVKDGKFWLGFEATNTTASLRIDCPVMAQTHCKDCDWLESPTNGAISYSDNATYQSVATFSCNTGYTLEGISTRECQINGSWSNESPSCNINDCSWLESPTDGTVSYSDNTTYQSVATFRCNAGYILEGSTTRKCGKDGTWSNDNPSCVNNDCAALYKRHWWILLIFFATQVLYMM